MSIPGYDWIVTQCGNHEGIAVAFLAIGGFMGWSVKKLSKKLDKKEYWEAHDKLLNTLAVIEHRVYSLATKQKQEPLSDDVLQRINGKT